MYTSTMCHCTMCYISYEYLNINNKQSQHKSYLNFQRSYFSFKTKSLCLPFTSQSLSISLLSFKVFLVDLKINIHNLVL